MDIFGKDISLNRNEAKEWRFENLLAFPTVTASDVGYVFCHTGLKKFYGWNGVAWVDLGATGTGGGGGVAEFLALTDTPSTYAGQAGKFAIVNNTENGLEFKDNFIATYFEGTYNDIKTLRDSSLLIPGNKYAITDYKTEYYIAGSNSSGKVIYKTIASNVSGWAVLDNDYAYDLGWGALVEIVELPDTYVGALVVGNTATVTNISSQYYFQFSNGMQSIIGLKLKYYLPRYASIPENTITNDSLGKPVMIPYGVINTQVHDGTEYMDMTAAENLAVPTEKIVLIAATVDSFDLIGASDTFDGDVVYYDMDDSNILNDNLEVIGTRKGFITRRINFLKTVDLNHDWRVMRWRRWLIDTPSRIKFINEDLVLDIITAGSFVVGVTYDIETTGDTDFTLIGAADSLPGTRFIATGVGVGTGTAIAPTRTRFSDGRALFTSKNRPITYTEGYYIAQNIEHVFLNLNFNAFKKNFTAVVESPISAKDFNTLPLDATYEPITIDRCLIDGNCKNTVIRLIPGELNLTTYIDIKGDFIDSTLDSSIDVRYGSTITIKNFTALDAVVFNDRVSSFTIDTLQTLSYLTVSKASTSFIQRCIMGTVNSNLPGMSMTISWIDFHSISNSDMVDTVIGNRSGFMHFSNVKAAVCSFFCGSSYVGGGLDGTYVREELRFDNSIFSYTGIRLLAGVDRISFTNMKFPDYNATVNQPQNLFLYDIPSGQSHKTFLLNRYNYNIYRLDVDATDALTVITEFTPINK